MYYVQTIRRKKRNYATILLQELLK